MKFERTWIGALCEERHLFCFVTFLKIKTPSHTLPPTPPSEHSLAGQKIATQSTFQVAAWCRDGQVMELNVVDTVCLDNGEVQPWGRPKWV